MHNKHPTPYLLALYNIVIFNNMTSTILFLKSETNFYRFILEIAKLSYTRFFSSFWWQ